MPRKLNHGKLRRKASAKSVSLARMVRVPASEVKSSALRNNPHSGLRSVTRALPANLGQFDWYKTRIMVDDRRLYYAGHPSLSDIQAYASRIRRGEMPPPVTVIYEKGNTDGKVRRFHGWGSYPRLTILDGAHRIEAAAEAGLKTLPAYVGVPRRELKKKAAG